MVLSNVDAGNITTQLKVFGELGLIGAKIDVLDEDTALIRVWRITVLTCVFVGSCELTFLFLACSYNLLETIYSSR